MNKVDSKLYLSGIEMTTLLSLLLFMMSPNCTLVELKLSLRYYKELQTDSPNCTLVELK